MNSSDMVEGLSTGTTNNPPISVQVADLKTEPHFGTFQFEGAGDDITPAACRGVRSGLRVMRRDLRLGVGAGAQQVGADRIKVGVLLEE